MQVSIAKRIRITILLCLALFFLFLPYFLDFYSQRQAYQWETMVQSHWQPEQEPLPIAELGIAVQDVEEWKKLDDEMVADNLPDTTSSDSNLKTDVTLTDNKATPLAQKVPIQERKQSEQLASKKERKLTLVLPDNLYQGRQLDWEEKKPLVMPDFFSPKPESFDGLQFGGRLIVDEEKTKKKDNKVESSYLDSVQGAEINIQIKTK